MPTRSLTPDLQKIAIEQLNEVPERIENDIEALRTWMEQQPHLKARSDDQFLLNYLRGCKFSLERAKSKIDSYYTLRTRFPEYFIGKNLDVDALVKIFKLGVVVYLPTPLNDNGPRLGIMRMGVYDPNEYTFLEINRAAQLMQQIIMREDDYAIINGVIHIMDVSDVKAGHFLQMTPSLAQKMTVFTEQALPLRLKGAHFINTPIGFDKIFNVFKPLMSKKQQGRLYLHGSKWDSLYEQIPKKYLPVEYGGENGSLPEVINDWADRILQQRELFLEEDQYGTDEKLRPGKPIDFESMFGMEGSFRKLDVD